MSSSRDRYGQIRSFTAREPVRTATLSNSFATRITRVGPRHTVREAAGSEAACTSSTTSTSCWATISERRSVPARSCASRHRLSRSSRSRRCVKELEQIGELKFIFTSPSFVTDKATDRLPKERREFFIPHARSGESTLYGSEFEIRLRNQMTQRAIARECGDWVRRKVRFRSNTTGAPMQQFGIVDDTPAYLPLQGFTSADLGYERGNAVSNMVTKLDEAPMTAQYVALFDQIWHNPDQLEDVTETVYEHIASVYAENSPARIYFLILYNLFAEFLDDISEDVLPNDLTGYQDTQIWKSLYNFQHDAATGVINKLETYNGCILADSVGLGKTFTALAVIKYYELRNKSVLVLAPKKLADNWTNYNANLTTNIFASTGSTTTCSPTPTCPRTRGESLGIPLDRVNWGNYDLVVIDESHNFRNADFATERETRYQRLMRQVIQQGVKTKVLMLSATPVNNHFTDLRNQLALAYEGESEQLAAKLEHFHERRRGLSAGPAGVQRVVEAPRRAAHHRRDPRPTRLRLLRAPRRRDDRPLPQAHPGVLRHLRDRRVPRTAPTDLRSLAADGVA